ncbi:MAG: Ig-like domain-containing protein [Candidatus Marinimicrobia bacterium]|nr:Ig-like domain-containing protein [Candidatus Neomarinimicrobiota bacterium]MCF7851571.1 Ig-like domain-containing protein [Candidatus Neomarinimicrobiota bacterium]
MKNKTMVLIPILISMLLFISCEEVSEDMEISTVELSKITPTNGSAGVATDATISVEFTQGMNMNSCESRFGIYMGQLDAIPTNMMGQMHGMLPGQFHWNGDTTLMIFTPDSMFMDSTMYSICLLEGMEMHHHGADSTMRMGHMQNHGNGAGNGIISYFHTGTQ